MSDQSIAAKLTNADHLRFLDWLDYYEGIEVGFANVLTLIGPEQADYGLAQQLLEKWRAWRAN